MQNNFSKKRFKIKMGVHKLEHTLTLLKIYQQEYLLLEFSVSRKLQTNSITSANNQGRCYFF